jgi:hypothetical protein
MIGFFVSSGVLFCVAGIVLIMFDNAVLGAFVLAIGLLKLKSLIEQEGGENGTFWGTPRWRPPK